MAGHQLNRLFWIKKEIEQIEEQIKGLTVLSAVQITGMPRGSSVGSSVEQFNEKLEELKEKLTNKLLEYIKERDVIENEIEKIEDPEIRVIARMRYIENKSWGVIGEELHMDRSTASKKLKRYEDKNL